MKITVTEFLQRLYNHRLLDHSLPFLKLESAYWQMFRFDDDGAEYYVAPDKLRYWLKK
jgi:hypothetical protein